MSALKMFLALGAMALTAAAASAQSAETAPTPSTAGRLIGINPSTGSYLALLHDNGGFVTGVGQGAGGLDVSDIEAGFNTFGFNTLSTAFHEADDFAVPAGKQWTLSDMKWYSYQSNAPTPIGSVTGAFIQVWSGTPGAGGVVVAGDLVTNRMVSNTFTNCYRTTATTHTSVARAIYELGIDMSFCPTLGAGTYYIQVAATGSAAFSGPWANVTVPRLSTDNGRTFTVSTGAWALTADGLSGLSQDFPYKLNGTESDVPIIYCTAKVNSLGCTPSISATGTPSHTPGVAFTITVTNVINNKPGLYLYSDAGQTASPFFGGTLCIGNPVRRSVAMNSGGNPPPNDCSGAYTMDWNMFVTGGLGGNPAAFLHVSGTRVQVQAWGRDQGFPAGQNATLSNAIEYAVD